MKTMQRILVIDDDDDTRETFQMWLATEGFDVDLAQSRDEACEIVAQRPPDMILMDYSMDGMSVDAFLKCCLSHCPTAKVAMLSGADGIQIGALPGVRALFKKPVEMSVLSRFLKK